MIYLAALFALAGAIIALVSVITGRMDVLVAVAIGVVALAVLLDKPWWNRLAP